jgi:hypothetical protein
MFDFLKRKKVFGTGGLDDPFDERDFCHKELGLAPIVEWKEKSPDQWRKFPIFNQNSSSSCVAQSVAKVLGIENYLEEGKFIQYSARDIYTRRTNEGEGMYYREGMDIGYKFGATIEQLMPSQNLSETLMNNKDDRKPIDNLIALIGKGGNYFSLPIDFDAIASVISQGKGVLLGTRFNSGDWKTGEVILRPNGIYGHAICGVDYCLWKGKKALVFDNSWGYSWGFNGQGIITEDYKDGLVTAWYYASLPNNWQQTQTQTIPKPKYQFNTDLRTGMQNVEVSKLQECLKYDGDFPISIPITGYFGGITLDAVKKFQTKYGIEPVGVVDTMTRKKLNELFS